MKLFAIAGLLLAGQAAAADPVRIMPLGSSIASGCWRALLWKRLTDNGIKNIDFVGTQKGMTCAFPYDSEHEGRPGALAIEYVEKNWLPGVLSSAKPDVVIVNVGGNDVIQHKATKDILNAYSTLVEQMRASNPRMKIVFSKLLPIAEWRFKGANAGIIALNEQIDGWANEKSTFRSPITVVDQYEGFVLDTDTDDGQHPNDVGAVKFANKFYDPVVKAITQVSTSVRWKGRRS